MSKPQVNTAEGGIGLSLLNSELSMIKVDFDAGRHGSRIDDTAVTS